MGSSELKRYLDLKRRVEQAQQKADKAEGALEQVMEQLEEKFDCTTLKEAKRKLVLLEKQKQKAETEFDEEMDRIEGKWDDELT